MADLKELRQEAEWQRVHGGGHVLVEAAQRIELIDAAEAEAVDGFPINGLPQVPPDFKDTLGEEVTAAIESLKAAKA